MLSPPSNRNNHYLAVGEFPGASLQLVTLFLGQAEGDSVVRRAISVMIH